MTASPYRENAAPSYTVRFRWRNDPVFKDGVLAGFEYPPRSRTFEKRVDADRFKALLDEIHEWDACAVVEPEYALEARP